MNGNKKQLVNADTLYEAIRAILENARASAYRAVNFAMIQAYWRIGYLIVEHEQEGKERAEYGKALLEEVSKRLTGEFGKGFDVTNLRKMRQFYLIFSKRDAARLKSGDVMKDSSPAGRRNRSNRKRPGNWPGWSRNILSAIRMCWSF